MSAITTVNRLDYVNIGLLIFSCILAFIMPFELFLFAYGVLGPLHYLTEISWLHDKNYYATNKRDVILLIIISLFLTVTNLKQYIGLADFEIEYKWINRAIFVAFASSLFFAFIKNNVYKIVGVIVVILLSAISDEHMLFFSMFLPTLIHVYVFTLLFMLYGALKNSSKVGYISVVLHFIIPFILFFVFQDTIFVGVTSYGLKSYKEFASLNNTLIHFLDAKSAGEKDMIQLIFHSQTGIAVMRFIAFAYTYHYLNWFSKTKVIGWHEIPKSRALLILVLWIVSVALYVVDYSLGFKWLFLLSFMHVMVEFPLNYISFVGIFKEIFKSKQTASH